MSKEEEQEKRKKLATEIAIDLFSDGHGNQADYLVMQFKELTLYEDVWTLESMIKIIEKHL